MVLSVPMVMVLGSFLCCVFLGSSLVVCDSRPYPSRDYEVPQWPRSISSFNSAFLWVVLRCSLVIRDNSGASSPDAPEMPRRPQESRPAGGGPNHEAS